MTPESEWRREWEILRAERVLARGEWRRAADGLAALARDPLGINHLVREHPLASTGIGAAIGALLGWLLPGRAPATRGEATPWATVLRDAAVAVAVPWLLRTLKDRFGGEADPAPPA